MLCFSLLNCLDQRRHYFEQVAHDSIVGRFEDRRVFVFVDGYHHFRPFHSDEVLDGAGDADGEVYLGRDGLAGTADLALHGEPAVVADRARGGEFGSKNLRQFFDNGQIVFFLDTATDGDDEFGGAQIDGALGFAERLIRLAADLGGVELRGECFDGGGSRGGWFQRTKGAGLDGGEPDSGLLQQPRR